MPKPTKPSRQELKTINSTQLFNYLEDFTAHYRLASAEAENSGDVPLDIKYCFEEFFKEIFNIFNPKSKLYREDSAALLAQVEEQVKTSKNFTPPDQEAFHSALAKKDKLAISADQLFQNLKELFDDYFLINPHEDKDKRILASYKREGFKECFAEFFDEISNALNSSNPLNQGNGLALKLKEKIRSSETFSALSFTIFCQVALEREILKKEDFEENELIHIPQAKRGSREEGILEPRSPSGRLSQSSLGSLENPKIRRFSAFKLTSSNQIDRGTEV